MFPSHIFTIIVSSHCTDRVATIQQLIGQLSESVVSYTRVLELENDYVPALKGITITQTLIILLFSVHIVHCTDSMMILIEYCCV